MNYTGDLNLSELVQRARAEGYGNLAPDEAAITATMLDGAAPKTCPLEEKRAGMEAHILKNFRSLRTQLPGCNGKCRTFGCPTVVVARCWRGFEKALL